MPRSDFPYVDNPTLADLYLLVMHMNEFMTFKFKQYDERFDRLEARIDRIESRIDIIETRLDRMEMTLNRLERRVDNHSDRIYALEQNAPT